MNRPTARAGHRRRALLVAAISAAVLSGCTGTPLWEHPERTSGNPADPVADPPVGGPGSPTTPAGRPGTVSSVRVTVTYSAFDAAHRAVEVAGVVDGVIEGDGRCTLTLSRSGTADVTAAAPATPDARSTSCGTLTVAAARLAPGAWIARLSYRSGHSSGLSDLVPITVA